MFSKILIANRGEIAVRIIRTARRLGVQTVAVVSVPDRSAPFAKLADEVIEIGPGPAAESYLRGDKIIAAARATGAQAVHPGYGFLAENAAFADAVGRAGLKFIGPSPEAMRRMGGKAEAKAIAATAGVPVVPGYAGESQEARRLAREAKHMGYPVMIKAVAGGGGRGMRRVERDGDFTAALESAQREAKAAFGDDRVLLEKVIARPRHVEVQVFGDAHANVVHLFERDCSLQRRNQKVIEEAPAPGMSAQLRAKITAAAVACAKAVGYEGAGTVEFLVEGAGTLGPEVPWYFIEMNTRLQVEHPVTESITGLDLVEWQLRVAAGERLPLTQAQIAMSGHAIEARLNAEDPANDFLPSTGPIVRLRLGEGEGLRCDAGVEEGSAISPFYDSMIAKLIAHGPDRAAAIARLACGLERTLVAGPKTNAAFLHALVTHSAFGRGEVDTGLIGRELNRLAPARRDARAVSIGVARMLKGEANARRSASGLPGDVTSPWSALDAFQLGAPRRQGRTVLVDGVATKVEVSWTADGPDVSVLGEPPTASAGPPPMVITVGDGAPVYVLSNMRQVVLDWPSYAVGAGDAGDGGAVYAPIVGRLAKVFVRQGDTVAKGDRVAVVEAMKMEHVLHAPRAGRIDKLAAREGDQVAEGALIAVLAEE
ncbi:MAG TPA: biotin carboxylase N-terminal domain-containing protein [Hyphomicrobiaceae bacterium]|nr:biotin carboxylase N-terminal domain-containing protein [Hyphomicrobiaceae bacterium]